MATTVSSIRLRPPVWGSALPSRGGATRADSVRRGLEALGGSPPRRVLIHDGARPLVSGALIDRVADALDTADAAAPLLPVTDTLRRSTGTGYEIVPRESLCARADTSRVSLREDLGRASALRWRTGHGRSGAGGARKSHDRGRRRRGDEHQADDRRRFRRRRETRSLLAARRAHRIRLRCASLRSGRPCLAVRREDCARARARRPFGRRCRAACADRCGSGRTRRRRYRRAFSAVGANAGAARLRICFSSTRRSSCATRAASSRMST